MYANFYKCLFLNRKSAKHIRVGKIGESFAASYLKSQNYIILEQSWSCPYGEIDIIAQDGRSLVFLEVKTRKARNYEGSYLLEQISSEKNKKIKFLGNIYARLNRPKIRHKRLCYLRWEIIGVEVFDSNKLSNYRIRHYLEI